MRTIIYTLVVVGILVVMGGWVRGKNTERLLQPCHHKNNWV